MHNKSRNRKPPPRVSVDWTTEDVYKLIAAVRERPCLWDVGSAQHGELTKRRAAWRKIHHLFKGAISCEQLKVKWQSLTCTFREKKRNAERSGLDPYDRDIIWKFWPKLQFLLGNNDSDVKIKRQSHSQSDEDSRDDDSEELEDDMELDDDRFSPVDIQEIMNTKKQEHLIPIPEPEEQENTSWCYKADDSMNNAGKHLLEAVSEIKKMSAQKSKKDKFDLFAEYVATRLRFMPEQYSAEAMLILNLELSKLEIKATNEQLRRQSIQHQNHVDFDEDSI